MTAGTTGAVVAAIAVLVILGALALLVRRGRAQEAHAEQGLYDVPAVEPLSPRDYRGHLPLDPDEPGLVDAFREGLRAGVIEGLVDPGVDVEPGASERERRVAELVELLAVDEQVRHQVAVLVVASLAAPGAGPAARGEAA